jgi:hypothetical protein
VPGFEHWPACKQIKFVTGLEQPGERHWTFLMIAAEAVHHAALTTEELTGIQLAIPLNDLSASTEAEIELDAAQNAKDIMASMESGNPVYTGCPGTRTETDELGVLADTFRHNCTPERCATCPLQQGVDPMTTAYAPLLDSSIWRGGQGSGNGLGAQARNVFEYAVRRARGVPQRHVHLSGRYLETKKPYLTKKAADTALDRLDEVGLLTRAGSGLYKLEQPLGQADLAALEDKLGTAAAYDRAVARNRAHWDTRNPLRRTRPSPASLNEQAQGGSDAQPTLGAAPSGAAVA